MRAAAPPPSSMVSAAPSKKLLTIFQVLSASATLEFAPPEMACASVQAPITLTHQKSVRVESIRAK